MKQRTINFRGKLLSIDEPQVMGIVNLTPDSFYRSSRVGGIEEAVARAGQMLAKGATIIDVGAASSRPGAEVIPVQEEMQRLIPVLETLIQSFPDAIFSVDTWRAEVARVALESGAHCINDITGGIVEPEIVGIVGGSNAPYVMMHMLGTPGQMPVRPFYSDIASDVLKFFVERIRVLREAGVTDIVLDPGFGFGKSVEDNFALLRKLEVFQFLELPLMIGISRKAMIWRTLEISSEDALNGTTALHMIALQKGADILRVHDVAAALQTIQLYQRFNTHPE